jgi:fused signal recognition particle receptor
LHRISGPTLVAELLEAAKKIRGDDAEGAVKEILAAQLSSKPRNLNSSLPTNVVLVVGVNGTGKTTSVAKLATLLHNNGDSVTLAAADTFRAAAVDQLTTWGQRIGVEVIAGKEGAEPASVAFDSVKRAIELGSKYLIVDTAGRLHNKSDLMAELGKS